MLFFILGCVSEHSDSSNPYNIVEVEEFTYSCNDWADSVYPLLEIETNQCKASHVYSTITFDDDRQEVHWLEETSECLWETKLYLVSDACISVTEVTLTAKLED